MSEQRRYRSVVADSARWDGFAFRDGDIVISTPPKSGTTWTQMLVALLIFGSPEFPRPLSEISLWLDMQLASRDDVFARLEQQTQCRVDTT
jgi:aryl sulfotransferase